MGIYGIFPILGNAGFISSTVGFRVQEHADLDTTEVGDPATLNAAL